MCSRVRRKRESEAGQSEGRRREKRQETKTYVDFCEKEDPAWFEGTSCLGEKVEVGVVEEGGGRTAESAVDPGRCAEKSEGQCWVKERRDWKACVQVEVLVRAACRGEWKMRGRSDVSA